VIVFQEGGVGVDVAAEAFAEDKLGLRKIESWKEGGARSVLEAVFGPEGLWAIWGLDSLEGLFVRVGGGE
jgi:hypothetical protein